MPDPTRADSLDLLQNSLNIQRKLKDLGYSREGNSLLTQSVFPRVDDANNQFIKRFTENRETFLPNNADNSRQVVHPSSYRTNDMGNTFEQREISNSLLNTDIPFTKYNRNIEPQSYSVYRQNVSEGNVDKVELPMYDELAMRPASELSDKEFTARFNKYGGAGLTPSRMRNLGLTEPLAPKPRSASSLARGEKRDALRKLMAEQGYKGDARKIMKEGSPEAMAYQQFLAAKQPVESNDKPLPTNQKDVTSHTLPEGWRVKRDASRDGAQYDYEQYDAATDSWKRKHTGNKDWTPGRRVVDVPEFANGGRIIRNIGQGMEIAGGFIPVPGLNVGVSALGAGLQNAGTGADFKEVATDMAFGAAKGALGPLGGMAVGAAEQMYDKNNISASEQKDAWAEQYDPSYAQRKAEDNRQSQMIGNIGMVAGLAGGAMGGFNGFKNKSDIVDAPIDNVAPEGLQSPFSNIEMGMGNEIPMAAYGGKVYAQGGPIYKAEGGEVIDGGNPTTLQGGHISPNSNNSGKIIGDSHNDPSGGVTMTGGEKIYSDRLTVDSSFLKDLDI